MKTKVLAMLVSSVLLVSCATRSAPQLEADPPPDPDAGKQLAEMIATPPGVQPLGSAAVPQPRLLSRAGVPEVDPVARRGSKIGWSAGIVDDTNAAATRFETSFDGALYVSVGLATTVDIPEMASGPHTFRVRSCNNEGCSDRDNLSAVGILGFNYVNAVPAPPTGLQLIPPATVPIADAQQGAELIQCHWFLSTRGQKLNGRQLNAVVAQYDGLVPPTWGSAELFMDRIVWSGFTP